MYGHYLVVKPWSRDFTTEENPPFEDNSLDKASGLHYRYYTKGLIWALASVIGNVVKVDYNTTDGRRGKFARVAVGVDMPKPLIPFLGIDGKKQVIVYEGLPSICYTCGKVGHIKENCSRSTNEKRNDQSATVMEETGNPTSVEMAEEKNLNSNDQGLYGP